jgi:guanylate kinase
MLEATGFRDWYYGTTFDLLDKDKINIGIFDPIRLKDLMENKEVEVLVFNIVASAKTRLMRQLNREDDPDVKEIIRRFEADNEDFKNIKFDYECITNENKKDLCAAVKDILSAAKEFQDKKD